MFYVLLMTSVYAQISPLQVTYALGDNITFVVADSVNVVSQSTVLLVNNKGPHPFSVQVALQQTKVTSVEFALPNQFAIGKGFFFQVIYEGTPSTTTLSSSEFEITGNGFQIADSSLVFNFPTRDIILQTDTVYDVSYTQNYINVPVNLTATLIRADGIPFGIFPLKSNLNPKHLTFEWLISNDLSTSKFYYIYVEAEFIDSKSGSFSPKFQINNPNDVGVADGVNVKFQFPTSNSVLVIHQQYSILWDYLVEPTSTVVLQLLSTNNKNVTLVETIGLLNNIQTSDTTGKFLFTIPSVNTGNFYQILLTGQIDGQFVFSELSQVFTIDIDNNNGINFTLPEAGDLFFVNQAYDVNFKLLGQKHPNSISFDLCKGAYDTFPVDQTISNNASSLSPFVDGQTSELSFRVPVFVLSHIITLEYNSAIQQQPFDGFTFTVPFFVTSGKDYFIRATIDYSDLSTKESNSNTFSIQGDQGIDYFYSCRS